MFLDASRSLFQNNREGQSEPRLTSQSGSMGLEARESIRNRITRGGKDKDPDFFPVPVRGFRY